MDKLRVAVIMENCLPVEGGGYSYYQTLLTAINRHSFHKDIEIVNIDVYNSGQQYLQFDKKLILVKKPLLANVSYKFLDVFYRLVHRVLKSHSKTYLEIISRAMDSINNRLVQKTLQRENIDLVYYLKPQDNLINYPMIVTHWDVGHKSMYPFPEVAWNGNFEKRESYYKKILSKAFLILCESETGARELQKYYPVNPDKIRVLPLFGGDVITQQVTEKDQLQVLSKYQLSKGGFYVYPAQFWAHKNHSTLIHAFSELLGDTGNKPLKLVLCGGDQGNLGYIKQLIAALGIGDNVVIPGFISNTSLYTFYKNAIALVMPTFLGPTNIPLIEAAELHCAVICSDLEGHREIMGDHALYFDPSDAGAIRDCMKKILENGLMEKLTTSAYEHIRNSSFQSERSIPLLDKYLKQVKPVRKAWGLNLRLIFAFAKIGILSLN